MDGSMDKCLDFNGVMFRYSVSGTGRPLILMHGWGCERSTVLSIEKVAKEAGWKVYNVDFPGFGESTEPTGVWGVEEYTRLIEKLAETEGMESPALIGHSFGGRVGILFSSRNKVDCMVLVDAAGVKPKRKLKYYLRVYRFKLLKQAVYIFKGKKKGEEFLNSYREKHGSADYRQASPLMRRILSKVVNEDLKDYMPKISCPTLLIWGEKDTATPVSDARTMESLIPDAGLVIIPEAGHYSFLDNPYMFSRVLANFLSSRNNA